MQQNVGIEINDIQSMAWWKDAKILEMAAIIRMLEGRIKELESGKQEDAKCLTENQ
jgi:hypothetical protein